MKKKLKLARIKRQQKKVVVFGYVARWDDGDL